MKKELLMPTPSNIFLVASKYTKDVYTKVVLRKIAFIIRSKNEFLPSAIYRSGAGMRGNMNGDLLSNPVEKENIEKFMSIPDLLVSNVIHGIRVRYGKFDYGITQMAARESTKQGYLRTYKLRVMRRPTSRWAWTTLVGNTDLSKDLLTISKYSTNIEYLRVPWNTNNYRPSQYVKHGDLMLLHPRKEVPTREDFLSKGKLVEVHYHYY